MGQRVGVEEWGGQLLKMVSMTHDFIISAGTQLQTDFLSFESNAPYAGLAHGGCIYFAHALRRIRRDGPLVWLPAGSV